MRIINDVLSVGGFVAWSALAVRAAIAGHTFDAAVCLILGSVMLVAIVMRARQEDI